MDKPTDDEIARVEAWNRQRRKDDAIKAALEYKLFNKAPHIMWHGESVDLSWPPEALLRLLYIQHERFNGPIPCPTG